MIATHREQALGDCWFQEPTSKQLFPGTSQDQRDQWKRRGMLAIRSLCSPGLWEYMQFRGTDQGSTLFPFNTD